MDKNEANAVIKNLSEVQIRTLRYARLGFGLGGSDERTVSALVERGLVRIAPFENARASNSIDGILTTEDGEKVLQTIDADEGVVVTKSLVDEDGGKTEQTEVEVKSASPDADVTKKNETSKNK